MNFGVFVCVCVLQRLMEEEPVDSISSPIRLKAIRVITDIWYCVPISSILPVSLLCCL